MQRVVRTTTVWHFSDTGHQVEAARVMLSRIGPGCHSYVFLTTAGGS